MDQYLREEEVGYHCETCRTRHEDVIVVLADGCVSRRSRFRYYHRRTVSKAQKALGSIRKEKMTYWQHSQ